ncbi:MAG: ABC transporter permease [Tepidanaerobacteraceae bacterium]|jgi:ribose/xylose/arabinose/galactoside ABC-type transport system permease subunit
MSGRRVNEKALKEDFKKIWSKLGVWLVFIFLFLLLSVAVGEKFLTVNNLINVIRQICVNSVVALGATFVVMCSEIDLSQGAMAALIGCICAMLMKSGAGVILSIIIALLIGTFIGIIMGAIVAYLNVPSFITTLGMMYSLQGVVLLLTNSQPISGLPKSFMILGRGYLGFVPVPVIIIFICFTIGALVVKYTQFGRNVLSVGENRLAARLSGINVSTIKVSVFALAGFFSALGGVILASRLSSGQPSSGSDLSLQALAAVFIGNASGGSVINTLAGALIMGLISNGLNLMQVNASWQKVALGIIIVGAVSMDILRNSRMGKKSS